jgi:hypothetical protein
MGAYLSSTKPSPDESNETSPLEETSRRSSLADHAGLEALLASMQDSVRDADVQLRNVTLLEEYFDEEDGQPEDCQQGQRIVSLLVNTLKAHPRRADLHKRTYTYLQSVCHTDRGSPLNISTFHTEGGIQAVVAAMKSSPSDADLHVEVCELIRCMHVPVPAVANFPTKKRAIAAAVAVAMRAHEGNALVVEPGLSVLQEMTADEAAYEEVLKEELIGVVLGAMRAHPDSTDIQLCACSVCGNILSEHMPETYLKMWHGNATRLILAAMECMMRDPAIDKSEEIPKQMLMKMLYTFYKIIERVRQPARDEPGLGVIPRAMAVDPKFFNLQHYGMISMCTCTTSNIPNRQHAGARAVSALLSAMQGLESRDPIYQSNAFVALANLCEGVPSHAKRLAQPENVAVLLQIMQQYRQEARMLAKGAYCIFRMSQMLDLREKEGLFNAGCTRTLIDFMNAHIREPAGMHPSEVDGSVPMECCRAIAEISRELSDDIRAQVVQQGFSDAVMSAVSNNMGLVCLQRLAGSALSDMLKDHEANVKAAGFKAIRTILAGMHACRNDAVAQMSGCSAVSMIMQVARSFPDSRRYQDELGECGGIGTISVCLTIFPVMFPFQLWLEMILNTLSVLIHACRRHVRNQDRCAEAHIVDLVARVVNSVGGCDVLNKKACKCLDAIAANHSRNAAEIVNHPILNERLRALEDDLDDMVRRDLQALFQRLRETASRQGTRDSDAQDVTTTGQNARNRNNYSSSSSTGVSGGDHRKQKEACTVCGKTAEETGKELLRCSACTIKPTYCGAECQRAA